MKNRIIISLLCFALICSCSSSNDNNRKNVDSLTKKNDTSLIKTDNEGNDCVFDTSMFKFTTNKLKEFKKDLAYTWDNIAKEATIKFPENDTLILSIGGCDHFGYTAIYLTDALKFNDQAFLIDKAKWIAKNFLGGGFDETIVYSISNNLYDFDNSKKEIKSLTIINKDTSVTNKIFEPILFELHGSRTKITVVGYEN